jgi:Putative adhesin
MKRIFLLGIGLAAVLAAQDARAQDNARQRIAMPFSNPTAPRKLVVDGVVGGVTIKGYDGKEAVVEYTPRGGVDFSRRSTTPPPEGMHRIGGVRGLDVTEQDNTIRVNSNSFITGGTDFVIQVPMETSVRVNAFAGGAITVDNIAGEIEATNMAGPVSITNASGSVVAHSMAGKITVALSKVMPDKSMSFSTMNGDIDVTLPADTKARLTMKTDNGDIFTDFDVALDPQAAPVIEDRKVKEKTKEGTKTVVRRRARNDGKTIGTINGGGPDMQFTTFNGRILIHKK